MREAGQGPQSSGEDGVTNEERARELYDRVMGVLLDMHMAEEMYVSNNEHGEWIATATAKHFWENNLPATDEAIRLDLKQRV
jgi:hypothetical protein